MGLAWFDGDRRIVARPHEVAAAVLNPIAASTRKPNIAAANNAFPNTYPTQENPMKFTKLAAITLASALAAVTLTVSAQVMVGGAAMYANKDIVDNAVNSKDHTTLVAAVKAAGLVDTLKSPGPFTVFAPTNEAFAALPAGTVDTLLKPENKATLVKVLTYHVVSGKMDAATLMAAVKAGGGKAMLKTVAGGSLSASMSGGHVMITDEKGDVATVTIADVMQSNGVIHVIDKVMLPN
jgi:uncharacterized surface protein with fasciclin (FAS1) repeats